MFRAVLDSNAIDPIAELPGAYETARAAVRDGQADLLFTHITIDELAATPDLDRRGRLLVLLISLGRLVPTGAMVLDCSRLDFCRLTEDTEAVEAFRSGNIRHSRDALIAATAQAEGCALVTADRRLAGRARERGIEILTPAELLLRLGYRTAPARPGGPPTGLVA